MSSTDYNQIQLVAFQLGDEEYAVPVQNVESIIRRRSRALRATASV